MGKHSASEASDSEASSAPEAPARPVLRIVKGDPSPEELAALTALLAAASHGAAPEPEPRLAGGWADPARLMRQPLRTGHGAWRSSAW